MRRLSRTREPRASATGLAAASRLPPACGGRGGAALDLAIDERRLRRVAAAAEAIAPRFVRRGDDQRVDVLLLAPWRWPRHVTNAWMP